MKKILFVILGVILLFGCIQTPKEETSEQLCNDPYIEYGYSCCLDQNSNSICDSDEIDSSASQPLPEPTYSDDPIYNGSSTSGDPSAHPSIYEENEVIPGQEITINGNLLTDSQINELIEYYGAAYPGDYWYDSISGACGRIGYGTECLMYPGHDFGPLSSDVSYGNTGVIINGRELTSDEVAYLEYIFKTPAQPGLYWLDSYGYIGYEGYSYPIANVYAASSSAYGGGSTWSSSITGAGGGSQGGCSYVNIPGSGGVSSGFVSTGC